VTGLAAIITEVFPNGYPAVDAMYVRFPGTPCVNVGTGDGALVRFDVYGTSACSVILSNTDPSILLLTAYVNNTLMYQCGNMS
jgi:hypothetical protein